MSIEQALVTIGRGPAIKGNGFLVLGGRIMTAAHVVAEALGLTHEKAAGDTPEGAVTVAFHRVDPDRPPVFEARVAPGGWRFRLKGRQLVEDVAVLDLVGAPPAGIEPLSLARETPRDGLDCRLQPFLPSALRTLPVEGRIGGEIEHGRLVLRPTESFWQFIEPGMSGAPVLPREGEQVIGIVAEADSTVKQAFLWSARLLRAALGEVEALARATGPSGDDAPNRDPPDPGAQAPRGTARAPAAIGESLRAFCGADPVAGEAAVAALAGAGPEVIATLLPMDGDQRQKRLRLRKLCKALGAPAVAPLIDAIDRGEWSTKTHAAACFAAFRGGRFATDGAYAAAAAGLFRLLKDRQDFDVQRMAIEALGHLGHAGAVRWQIQNLAKYDTFSPSALHSVSRYAAGKLSGFVIAAMARSWLQNPDQSTVADLEAFIGFADEHYGPFNVASALSPAIDAITPAGADALAGRWLKSRDPRLAATAADGLAVLRLQRSAPVLADLLIADDDSGALAGKAAFGIAGIEGAPAARALAAVMRRSGAEESAPVSGALLAPFAMLWRHLDDWPGGPRRVEQALSGGWSEAADWMLVSLALRGAAPTADIEPRLDGDRPETRGAAALAFAYAAPARALNLLDGRAEEASDLLERLLIQSALIRAGRPGLGHVLHAALCDASDDWPRRRPWWRYQILGALAAADGGGERAGLWAEISGDDAPRLRAVADSFRAAPV